MNSMLLSSMIYNKDFLKFKIERLLPERKTLSKSILNKGYLPVVIDSLDENISKSLSRKRSSSNYKIHGRCFQFHKDMTTEDILLNLQNRIVLQPGVMINLGLENGSIIKKDQNVETLYNMYKNPSDDILYLIITLETTLYGYILSIINYIFKKNGNTNSNTINFEEDDVTEMMYDFVSKKLEIDTTSFIKSQTLYKHYTSYYTIQDGDIEDFKLLNSVISKKLGINIAYQNGQMGFNVQLK